MIEVKCVLCQTTEDEETEEDLNNTTTFQSLVTNNAIIPGSIKQGVQSPATLRRIEA